MALFAPDPDIPVLLQAADRVSCDHPFYTGPLGGLGAFGSSESPDRVVSFAIQVWQRGLELRVLIKGCN